MMAAPKQKKGFEYGPHSILVFLALVAVVLATFAIFRGIPTEPDLPKDSNIGASTLINFQDKDVTVSELLVSEKNLLIFWATWCSPCIDEIKEMPKLLPLIKEKGYTPVFVNYDSPENKVIADNFAKKYGVISAFDFRGELLFNLGISSLPLSLVVDKSGKILKTLRGEIRISRL